MDLLTLPSVVFGKPKIAPCVGESDMRILTALTRPLASSIVSGAVELSSGDPLNPPKSVVFT